MALWGIGEQVKHYFADELEKDVEMTGAQFIVKFLEQKGVTQIYGIPGAAILPFYEAVLEQGRIRSINVRHEQTAVFMADGYARSTGKVGICAATSGPSATNFLTGLYSAYGDGIPLLAFTGQVPTNQIGKGAQAAPIVEMARPVTKAAYLVTEPTDLPRVMNQAWNLATKGRRGPVLIDIPVNVQKGLLKVNLEECLREELDEQGDLKDPSESQLAQVIKKIEEAKNPVLMVGKRVALEGAAEELKELAELLQVPVVSSFMGKDSFPNYHRLYAGIADAVCETPLGNQMVMAADLILNLGGKFDGQSKEEVNVLNNSCKVINITVDEGKALQQAADNLTIVYNLKSFIRELSKWVISSGYKPGTEALERIEFLQQERTRLAGQTSSEASPRTAKQAIVEVRKGLRPDAIVALGSGLTPLWASQLSEAYEPRTFLITGHAGTMGWGLGAALGAQLAYPQRQVINILEDASLSMSLQELATAAKHNIPVVVVVLTSIPTRRGTATELGYANHVQGHQRGLDFVAAAKGMGVEAELIERPEQITVALTRAFSAYRPYLIEVLVDGDGQLLKGALSGVREVS